jgi:hypothetical protein
MGAGSAEEEEDGSEFPGLKMYERHAPFGTHLGAAGMEIHLGDIYQR